MTLFRRMRRRIHARDWLLLLGARSSLPVRCLCWAREPRASATQYRYMSCIVVHVVMYRFIVIHTPPPSYTHSSSHLPYSPSIRHLRPMPASFPPHPLPPRAIHARSKSSSSSARRGERRNCSCTTPRGVAHERPPSPPLLLSSSTPCLIVDVDTGLFW